MGIFIKFECDNCGEYECDCSLELRNQKHNIIPEPEEILNGFVRGDIVCTGLDENKNPINERYITKIKNGKIYFVDINNKGDGVEYEWNGEKLIKICSVLG